MIRRQFISRFRQIRMRAVGGRRRGRRAVSRQTLVELARELVKGVALERAQGRNDRLAGRAQRHDILGGGCCRWPCGRGVAGPADSETAVAAEDALAVEYRKSGKLDHETFGAIVDRPGDAQPAPRVMAGQSERDLALEIEMVLPAAAQLAGEPARGRRERGLDLAARA